MKLKNKYKIITLIAATIMCLIVIYLHLLSHKNTQKIYLAQTEQAIFNLKKDFLEDTVNNIFLELDRLRETKFLNYKKNTDVRLKRFEEELDLSERTFAAFFIDKFNDDLNSKMWTAFLYDNKTGEILYNSSELNTKNIDKEHLKSLLSSYAVIEKGNLEGIFGVSKSYIDELVKEEIGDMIRSKKFSNDSYIWVNEVIDYDGGENYAIRRVHPNLIETEGTYLSTHTEDMKGNLPYLEELEGVKKNGALFFTYYFKELNSSEISEKITYAKLYKDYNWIIAMGVHLNDIDAYTKKVTHQIDSLSSESIINLLGYILIVLLIGFTTLYLAEKKHLSIASKALEKEFNLDTLTKASSRRCGERTLIAFFKQYKLTGESPAIMMFDVDDFKRINDKYGHNIGDLVLREIVKASNDIIRSSDRLIRWGGDEFVGIFPGLRADHIMDFGNTLLDGISSLEIPIGTGTISTTICIGFSYFKDSDHDYTDVLKRADDAMYHSKKQGKNRVNKL